MSDVAGAGKTAVVRYLQSRVEVLDVKPEMKNLISFIIDNSDAYLDFFVDYAKRSKGRERRG
jgi:hypothetical protein